jgi:1-acyl-sn-glycerol-3-phosphate acyltransferase
MQYLLLPFRVIYKIYYFLFFVLSLVIIYPVIYYLLAKPKRFPKAFVVMRWHAYILMIFAGARLKVSGVENIPKEGAYIICPNHSSFLDIFCLYSIFRRYFVFTGKKEIEKWPLFHIYYTSGMNILVDRTNKSGDFKAMKRMSQEIDRGNPLMIFPEGTISKNAPRMAPFKSGSFAIAIQKQIPVLPVTFVTNWKRLQRTGIWKGKAGPGIAKVVIHKPIFTTGLRKENITQLQSTVEAIINGPLSIYQEVD